MSCRAMACLQSEWITSMEMAEPALPRRSDATCWWSPTPAIGTPLSDTIMSPGPHVPWRSQQLPLRTCSTRHVPASKCSPWWRNWWSDCSSSMPESIAPSASGDSSTGRSCTPPLPATKPVTDELSAFCCELATRAAGSWLLLRGEILPSPASSRALAGAGCCLGRPLSNGAGTQALTIGEGAPGRPPGTARLGASNFIAAGMATRGSSALHFAAEDKRCGEMALSWGVRGDTLPSLISS